MRKVVAFPLVLLCFGCSPPPQRKVRVIVLDSVSSILPETRRILSFFDEVSHSDLVIRAVRQNYPKGPVTLIVVDDAEGRIDRARYFEALCRLLEATKKDPTTSIVVNISFGSPHPDPAERELIEKVVEGGVVVVASAGNDSSRRAFYPAGYDDVIAVAGTERNRLAPYSNYGEFVDIAADGRIELPQQTTLPGGIATREVVARGTSFASPRVAGLIAYILSRNPKLSPLEVREILLKSSHPFPPPEDTLPFRLLDKTRACEMAVPGYRRSRVLRRAFVVSTAVLILVCIGACRRERTAGDVVLLLKLVGIVLAGVGVILCTLVVSGAIPVPRKWDPELVKGSCLFISLLVGGMLGSLVLGSLLSTGLSTASHAVRCIRMRAQISQLERASPDELRLKIQEPLWLLGRVPTELRHRLLTLLLNTEKVGYAPLIVLFEDTETYQLCKNELTRIVDHLAQRSLSGDRRARTILENVASLYGQIEESIIWHARETIRRLES